MDKLDCREMLRWRAGVRRALAGNAYRCGNKTIRRAWPTMFVTAFERALRTESVKSMVDLEMRFPQWTVLSSTARALFGDLRAAARMRELLQTEQSGAAGIKLVSQAVDSLVCWCHSFFRSHPRPDRR
jgi:hypothetical protein